LDESTSSVLRENEEESTDNGGAQELELGSGSCLLQ